jgi:hypothetical protein
MSWTDPAGPRVSLRRVVLLLLFGASACMALTPPGRWVASRMLPRHGPPPWAPLYLEGSPRAGRLAEKLDLAFDDMHDDADHPVGTLPLPTDGNLTARLAGLDGWCTCVVLERGSTPAQIEAAGIADREACVAIANSGSRGFLSPARLAQLDDCAWRSWTVLLLDDRGRRLGSTSICALRPGFELTDPAQHLYTQRPGAPGDGPLPGVRVFRRTNTGEVERE